MTTLIVKAHPLTGADSHSMHLLEVFLKAYQEKNPNETIQLLDLYSEDIPEVDGDILTGWSALKKGQEFTSLTSSQMQKISRFNELTEQFLEADKIVMANALWNLNIPTRLKAWVDTIMIAGKTFAYTVDGPAGLTTGKKALHIQSNGGFYHGEDFASKYLKSIFSFMGVTDFDEVFVEGIDYNPDKEEEIMAAAEIKTVEAAERF